MTQQKVIVLPFSIDPYGKVSVSTDETKIWADRVLSVLGTTLNERVMHPEIGTALNSALFQSSDDADSIIKSEVAHGFTTQLPLLKLVNIKLSFNEATGTHSVTVVYDLPNNKTVDTTIGFVTVDGTNPIYQETL